MRLSSPLQVSVEVEALSPVPAVPLKGEGVAPPGLEHPLAKERLEQPLIGGSERAEYY